MATIGERLSSLIEDKMLQQKEIAEMMGMKVSTFNGYVNDVREPSVKVLKKMADFFGVSMDYITGFSDDKEGRKVVVNTRIPHLNDRLNEFVNNPENKIYIEIASHIKEKLNKEKYKVEKAKIQQEKKKSDKENKDNKNPGKSPENKIR